MTGPYGPMPTALEALRALADEFDRYSDELAAIGRGHGDYGCERKLARMVLDDAERKGIARVMVALDFDPDMHSVDYTPEQCETPDTGPASSGGYES